MLQGAECLVEMVGADASGGGNRSHAAGRPAAALGIEKPAKVHARSEVADPRRAAAGGGRSQWMLEHGKILELGVHQ